MTFEEQLAQERARLDAAKTKVTPDMLLRAEQRAKLREITKEREAKEREARDLSLADRLDAAREAQPDSAFEAVTVETFPDAFIVMRNGKAHRAWEQAMRGAMATSQRKGASLDASPINRRYVIDCIYDWNGDQNFDQGAQGTELSHKLDLYLQENPGLVTPLTDAIGRLVGLFAEERSKSD